MATVQGTVITVALETDVAKNGGGTYKGWELVYKTPQGEVRSIAKPIQGLRFNAPLKVQLEGLAAGDEFTLEQEKNENGFNTVTSVVKGFSNTASPSQASQAAPAGKATPYQPRAASTYETAEERKARQRLIVRQSSLTTAVSLLPKPTKETVLPLAEELVSWVFEEGNVGLQNMDSDIPD